MRRILVSLVLSVALLPSPAVVLPATEVSPLLLSYFQARDSGALGDVEGSAYEETRKPSASPLPYESLPVLLLPYSPELEAQLDAIRLHQRESGQAYTQADTRVRAARLAYERALLFAGGGEFIRGEVTDVKGRFRIAALPAGRWLLLAWWEVPHPLTSKSLRKHEVGQFADNPQHTGYSAVTYWRMRVEVKAGEATEVRLHDRNAWMTGIREDLWLSIPTGPPGPRPTKQKGVTR